MKSLSALLATTLLLVSVSSFAAGTDVFVVDGTEKLSMKKIIADGEDLQSVYGFDEYKYCYEGNADAALNLIRKWKQDGIFYAGGGGGFELKSLEVLRGFVTYDIKLTFEDEVVPGEFTNVLVKPCSVVQ